MSRIGRLWDAPAAVPPPPRRVWRDWALIAVLPPLIVVEAALRTDVPWRWLWAVVLLVLVPTLLFRRVRPFTATALAIATSTVVGLAVGGEPQLYCAAYFVVLLYALARWGRPRAIIGGAALLLAGILVPGLFTAPVLTNVLGGIIVVALVGSLGAVFRLRAGARSRELASVRLQERERLARDLHDTVAHHLSAIAIQAQAGTAVASTDPRQAAGVLAVIENEASRTLDEMRTMVRLLRTETDDSAREHTHPDGTPSQDARSPLPGIAELHALAVVGDAGPEVSVDVTGDASAVPSAVGTAVFRIGQEGITNARRHGRGATRIDVRVDIRLTEVRILVRNDGSPATTATPGFGVTGMIERATLLSGTCSFGPLDDGGWAVEATIPTVGRAS